MKSIEDILALCIEDIKAGRATLGDCLERYPSARPELEPLLKIAISIREPAVVRPSDDFRVRARAQLMNGIYREQEAKTSRPGLFGRIRFAGAFRAVAIAVAVLLVISALGTGSAYASQDSLPGEALYPVKTGTEQARRMLTFNETERLELELSFAGTRLEEMDSLVEENPAMIETALEGYEFNMRQAASTAGDSVDEDASAVAWEAVASAASRHVNKLEGIQDSSGSTDGESLKTAARLALMTQEQALAGLAGVDPLRATEMNLENMRERLNRAFALANKGDTAGAEESLGQFMELRGLGEVISQTAGNSGHDVSGIEKMLEEAKPAQQEIVTRISGKVKGEAVTSVKEALDIPEKGGGQPQQEPAQEPQQGPKPEQAGNDAAGKPENSAAEPAGKPEEPAGKPAETGSPAKKPEEPEKNGSGSGNSENSANPGSSGDSGNSGGSGSSEDFANLGNSGNPGSSGNAGSSEDSANPGKSGNPGKDKK